MKVLEDLEWHIKALLVLYRRLHSKEDQIYVFPETKLRGFSPNFYTYIHKSLKDLWM